MKAFSELSTLGAGGWLESVSIGCESASSQMSFILALAFASAALDGAIHSLFEAFVKPKPLAKAAGSLMLVEAG